MSSFALYYKKKVGSKDDNDLAVDINFNLWCQCDWGKEPPYLDVGIMLRNSEQAENLYFYLPFKVKKDEIIDLGQILNDGTILNAVFNENYTIEDQSTKRYIVKDQDNTIFYLYTLDVKKDINLQDCDEGTILNFKPKSKETYYIRFRIKSLNLYTFIREYKPANTWLQSFFSSTYIIDFRYNYLRSFTKTQIEEFFNQNNRMVKTEKLHFLLMDKAHVDVKCGTDVKIRELEKNIWDKYVHNKETTDIVAYHTSKKVEPTKEEKGFGIVSWEFFAKLRVYKSGFIKYILAFIIITILLNLGSNYLYDLLFK